MRRRSGGHCSAMTETWRRPSRWRNQSTVRWRTTVTSQVEPARDSPHGSGASLNLRAARWGIKEGWEPSLLAAAHALSLRLEELLQVLLFREPRRMAGGAAVLEVGPVIGRSDDPAQHAGNPRGEGQGPFPFPLPRSPFRFSLPPHTRFRHTLPPA